MDDPQGVDGGAGQEPDYAEMQRPDALKDLNDDEWNATPPTVRKAILERDARGKDNHREQIARLTGEMNSMREMLASQQNGNGHAAPAKKPGLEGMSMEELESYHDRAEDILARSRKEPDNEALQAEASKLTPAVMRELMKHIAKRAVGFDPEEVKALRAEINGGKEAQRLNGALTQRVSQEFGQAAMLPGSATRIAAEKAYTELQAALKEGLTPETALQYAAYKIAAGANGNRDGRANGVEANGARRLADNGKPDVAGILRSLGSRAAALRAKGDALGAAELEVEADLFRTMPDNVLSNGR